jgi:hypothetical protein
VRYPFQGCRDCDEADDLRSVAKKEIIMVRSNALALFLLVGLIAAAAPAFAERGGNGNGNGPGGGNDASSSIELATVSGVARSGAPTPAYGDSVTFATTIERLAGWEYPMVAVTCYQDVNGDGALDTNMFGPDIVFGLLREPTATFELAGSSKWADRGGDAVCRADLDAYGWKGGQQSIRVLASTENWTVTG